MAVKGPGWRKLTKLMAYHVLGDENRDEFFTVVHGKGQTDHLRRHIGSSRPGLDNFTGPGFVSLLDFPQ